MSLDFPARGTISKTILVRKLSGGGWGIKRYSASMCERDCHCELLWRLSRWACRCDAQPMVTHHQQNHPHNSDISLVKLQHKFSSYPWLQRQHDIPGQTKTKLLSCRKRYRPFVKKRHIKYVPYKRYSTRGSDVKFNTATQNTALTHVFKSDKQLKRSRR